MAARNAKTAKPVEETIIDTPVQPTEVHDAITSHFEGVQAPTAKTAAASASPAPVPVGTQTVNPMVEHQGPVPKTSAQALGFAPSETIVDQVQDTPRPVGVPVVTVRMTRTVEQMTVMDASGQRTYDLVEGSAYQVPLDVAAELNRIGAVIVFK